MKKDAERVKSQQEKHQNNVTEVVQVFLVLTLNIFQTFFTVSLVDSEQVKATLGYVSSM